MNLNDEKKVGGNFNVQDIGPPGLLIPGPEGPKSMEMEVEEMEDSYVGSPDVGPPARKRLKMDEEESQNFNQPAVLQKRILEYYGLKMKNSREKYLELAAELFFLRAGGNMMDYGVWRKRPATPHLLSFLKAQRLDASDEVARPAIGATPVALSTHLPSDVQHLSAQGGAPLISEPTTQPSETKEQIIPTTVSPTVQDHMLEKAKQEAYVVRRVGELQRAGLWSEKRLPKVMEPPRCKAHWDYLLEEMAWLANDFAQERKWKKNAAKKCARMVQKYFQDKAQSALRAEKAHELHLRRLAAFAAKEIRTFWSNVEKLVEFKRNSRLEEQRKVALDQQLSFIVDQTEKYSKKLAFGLKEGGSSTVPSDDEFKPNMSGSEDDEETIEAAEKEDIKCGGNSSRKSEIEALQKEALMDLDEVLDALPPAYLARRDRSASSSEYSAESESSDDESTVAAQEKTEDPAEHDREMTDLKAEAEMSVDELRKKYSLPPPVSSSPRTQRGMEESPLTSEPEEEEEDSESDESEERENKNVVASSDLGALVDDNVDMDSGEAEERVRAAAAEAEALQPTGYTLSDTAVATPVPDLIKHSLREYQHVGLHWLATMRSRKLNGILADEMGLGKTIQTIALLAHLAEKGDWGPHLVVVPTSVTLNWEMEFKKWCPAFKIMTYYGSIKERKAKRSGWTKPNAFHICIASYKLVVQDHQSFRRKKWSYLILDEAQNIKNFRSQRWQLLLNFQTERRLLLTGTPLQNDLMELWSLMHFLMPGVFASHREFKEWFGIPVSSMVEGTEAYNENLIRRLHKVLRPFLLRRLKSEVEKQMPKKYEHVLMCRLSKRQRYLYDDFMSRAKTKETLSSGNLLSVMNVLMQLRKVCNHPNLFEARPIVSPLRLQSLDVYVPAMLLICSPEEPTVHLPPTLLELEIGDAFSAHRRRHLAAPRRLLEEVSSVVLPPRVPKATVHLHVRASRLQPPKMTNNVFTVKNDGGCNIVMNDTQQDEFHNATLLEKKKRRRAETLSRVGRENENRSWRLPLYGCDLRGALTIAPPPVPYQMDHLDFTKELIEEFIMYVPPATCPGSNLVVGRGAAAARARRERINAHLTLYFKQALTPLHNVITRFAVSFPHPRLIQYDCGKLQTLDVLLRELKSEDHRALIFTQMTRMLDVLEAFLTHRGHTYLRLDGSTKVEQRQSLVERFNNDRRVFVFILSTRSGGVGLNLTGADTVIFYDSDWNPTMDAQAQDRCHRIGQTRDVHIYRLVSHRTIEENILRKANQKRQLGEITIDDGNFTTAALKQETVRDLFNEDVELTESSLVSKVEEAANPEELEKALEGCEDEADACAARLARAEARAELAEFDEKVPFNEETSKPKKSRVEQELEALDEQLSPIERYAMRLVECSEEANEAERRANADIQKQLKEWEDARLKLAQTDNQEHIKENNDEESDMDCDLTYGRTDSTQIWISENTGESMPMWCPPTPPRTTHDMYIDTCSSALYASSAALESELPPIRSRSSHPRSPRPTSDARMPIRQTPRAPRSLFERPQQPLTLVRTRARPRPSGTIRENERATEWSRQEDAALRLAAKLQGLPPDRKSHANAVTSNWDFAADLVSDIGRIYRSPRACRERAELAPSVEEERRAQRRAHNKGSSRRPTNDDTSPRIPRNHLDAIHTIHAALQSKRPTPKRLREEMGANKNVRQAGVLNECNIDYNSPPTPMAAAAARAERIARDKVKESGGSGLVRQGSSGVQQAPPPPHPAATATIVASQQQHGAPSSVGATAVVATSIGGSNVATTTQRVVRAAAPQPKPSISGVAISGGNMVTGGSSSGGVLLRQQTLVKHQLKILQQPGQGLSGGVEVRRAPIGAVRVATTRLQAPTRPRLPPNIRPNTIQQPPH